MFENGWTIVTGASAGIGEGFARRLAQEGARLVLVARRRERLAALARELDVESRVVEADLSKAAGRDLLWEVVASLGEPVELLVNNAGFGLWGRARDLDRGQQLEMIQTNCAALVDLSHRYLQQRRDRPGALINVASVAGLRPIPGFAVYTATKHFVVAFSLALAAEEGRSGTRVLALCPGPVATEFQRVAGSRIGGGSRMVAIPVEQVVDEALAALARGDRLWVPGAAMRALTRSAQLVPQGAFASLAGRARRRGQRADG